MTGPGGLDAPAPPPMRAAPRWALGLAAALAMLFGAGAAVATLGPRILDVGDLGWLLHGTLGPDPVAYLMAWTYFARTPWTLPLGLNPDYGLEMASAIFYVDAIPLAAFVAKALRPYAVIAQYWGPWMVLCGALQAAFAWRLLGEAVRDPVARGLGAALFAVQPMMLNRMGGHFQLVSQWLLLWALWLCLRREAPRQGRQWVACLGVASVVNAYLLAMASALWAADWLDRARLAPAGRRGLALRVAQLLLVPAVVLLGLWLAGFFSVQGDVEAVGLRYGQTQLDLTAPFDAVEWGWLLPAEPGLRHWEHGGSYLGAGSLLLLALGAVLAWRRRPGAALRRHAALLAALAAMLAYALTNHPAFAGHAVTLFDLPPALQRLADMLRASERFFWPVAYALLAGAIALAAGALRGGALRAMLAAALLLQAVDVQAGMQRYRALVAVAPRVAPPRLRDPFWERAANVYARLRAVPFDNEAPRWDELARFAAAHRMPTDSVYLSRVDPAVVARHNADIAADLAAGNWEEGTLYVLRDEATRARVAARLDPTRDQLAMHDGFLVFAPGWLGPGPSIARARRRPSPLPAAPEGCRPATATVAADPAAPAVACRARRT